MSYLTNLWNKVMAKLGRIGQILGLLAEELHVAIKAGDKAKALEISAKAREKALDVIALCDSVDQALEDGILTAVEGAEVALKLEAIAD